MKIKKLEIENDDFKLYLDNLNSLFAEYNNKENFLKKKKKNKKKKKKKKFYIFYLNKKN